MGLEDGIFPDNYSDEVKLYKAILEHQFHPNEESIKITETNIKALSSIVFPGFIYLGLSLFLESFGHSLARFLLEDSELPNMPELLKIKEYSVFHKQILSVSSAAFKLFQIWQIGFYPLRVVSSWVNKVLLSTLTYVAMGFQHANFMFKTSN